MRAVQFPSLFSCILFTHVKQDKLSCVNLRKINAPMEIHLTSATIFDIWRQFLCSAKTQTPEEISQIVEFSVFLANGKFAAERSRGSKSQLESKWCTRTYWTKRIQIWWLSLTWPSASFAQKLQDFALPDRSGKNGSLVNHRLNFSLISKIIIWKKRC